MKRSQVTEALIRLYREEDTTQPDSLWFSTGEIAREAEVANAGPTLEALKGFGLVEKRTVTARRQKLNEDGTTYKVGYKRGEWKLAVTWEKFCEEYFKYLSRGRSNKSGRRSK